jgi:dehydrogenase/reductase SDR family member 7B
MSYVGQIVWITGASSGIGEALARAFADGGASIILSGRRIQELERVATELKGNTLILPFESTDYDALPAVAQRASEWQGSVDMLINNAGIGQRSLALDTNFETYRRLIEVDYLAPLRLTQLVLPQMIKNGKGHVVAVSSVAGKFGTPMRTGYCAAKHALIGYFDALRAEVEIAYDVKVTVVLPGSVRTAIAIHALSGDGSLYGQSDSNIENAMTAGTAAEAIMAGLAAGHREIVVAEGIDLIGLQVRANDPERLYDVMAQEGARLAALRACHGPRVHMELAIARTSAAPLQS